MNAIPKMKKNVIYHQLTTALHSYSIDAKCQVSRVIKNAKQWMAWFGKPGTSWKNVKLLLSRCRNISTDLNRENYKIATYGAIRQLKEKPGPGDAVDYLQETISKIEVADAKLEGTPDRREYRNGCLN